MTMSLAYERLTREFSWFMLPQLEAELDRPYEFDYGCACDCDQCFEGNHGFCELGVCWKN